MKYFGNSSIAFVIAHEFAHALQQGLEIEYEKPHSELQADCLAGYFIQKGNEELGVTRESILEMASAAYGIGVKVMEQEHKEPMLFYLGWEE